MKQDRISTASNADQALTTPQERQQKARAVQSGLFVVFHGRSIEEAGSGLMRALQFFLQPMLQGLKADAQEPV
ncbi:hypothetical protein, partial [Herbaspirillum sp. 3C11]|uniref:hypothetical protein n=1 Tax=Herbaspirillum sp. 3C11 TaxID=2559615 RepID=UPI001ADBE97F